MTSVIAWLAVDQRYPTALYFATDSRRTFADGSYRDDCRKVFVPRDSREFFAFTGDVNFPTSALTHICTLLEQSAVPAQLLGSAYGRSSWVLDTLNSLLAQSPHRPAYNFTILHGSRNGFGAGVAFVLHAYYYCVGETLIQAKELSSGLAQSSVVEIVGTGKLHVRQALEAETAMGGSYSRVFFAGFCRALEDKLDTYSGGAVQLAGLGNKGVARHHGVVLAGRSFYQGSNCTIPLEGNVQWWNEMFQRVDQSGKLIKGAQRHAWERPLRRTLPA